MSDQLSFDAIHVAEPSRPPCGVCGDPVAWQSRNGRWSKYCGSNTCLSRTRTCKQCGASFVMHEGEAGTKYCSLRCKAEGYTRAWKVNHPNRTQRQCAWCDEWYEGSRQSGKWPYICEGCLAPISHVVHALKSHNVSHERARKLTVDASCDICGDDLLGWVRPAYASKKTMRQALTVDHDHSCCPGQYSCGRCVRGLLCANCNMILGMLHDDIAKAHAVIEYLQRHGR